MAWCLGGRPTPTSGQVSGGGPPPQLPRDPGQPPAHRPGGSIVVREEAVGHRQRLPPSRHLPRRRRDVRRGGVTHKTARRLVNKREAAEHRVARRRNYESVRTLRSGSHPWTAPAASCCSGSSPPPTNAAAWPSPATGPSRNGAGSYPSTAPPSACSTGCCTTTTSSRHRRRELPDERSPKPNRRTPLEALTQHARWGLFPATSGDRHLHARATTGTIRAQLINVPARLANSARRLTLHLPCAWPWEHAFTELLTRVCGPPAPGPP